MNETDLFRHQNEFLGDTMTLSIVRLGSPRGASEGLRIGTVRRPPRGVPRSEFAKRNYYDVWLPLLAPSEVLFKQARAASDEAAWKQFTKKFRAEMSRPEPARILDLLAALSHSTNLAVGCYCDDEAHCHRRVLRELLAERSAKLAQSPEDH